MYNLLRAAGAEDKADKGKASVFIVNDGKAVKRAVETGIADDAYIEILKGVNENEIVIIGPPKIARFLRDGEKVTMGAVMSAQGQSIEVWYAFVLKGDAMNGSVSANVQGQSMAFDLLLKRAP